MPVPSEDYQFSIRRENAKISGNITYCCQLIVIFGFYFYTAFKH